MLKNVSKKKCIALIASAIVVVTLAAVLLIVWLLPREYETNYYYANMIPNDSVLENVMGISNYVFIAQVEEQLKTTVEKYAGDDTPISNYRVRILQNLKGELQIGGMADVSKWGAGVLEKQKIILMRENDTPLPKVGEIYAFAMYGTSDGGLSTSAINSIVPLSDMEFTKEELQAIKDGKEIPLKRLRESKIVQKYEYAIAGQAIVNVDNYASKYDVKFAEGGEKFVPNIKTKEAKAGQWGTVTGYLERPEGMVNPDPPPPEPPIEEYVPSLPDGWKPGDPTLAN